MSTENRDFMKDLNMSIKPVFTVLRTKHHEIKIDSEDTRFIKWCKKNKLDPVYLNICEVERYAEEHQAYYDWGYYGEEVQIEVIETNYK